MNQLKLSLFIALSIVLSAAFMTDRISPEQLINTKWISPVKDSCFTSLCFNSDRTVMFQECGDEWSWEIGYTISEDLIHVNISDSLGTQMTFRMDEGILRQVSKMDDRYPKNFIRVPAGACE